MNNKSTINPSKALKTQNFNQIKKENSNPLVSVIIPTFNRTSLLVEAMDSIWSQTYRPIELIIVDDGSDIDTASIVETWKQSYQDNNEFKTLLLKKENGGAPAARNFGIQASHGEYIQFHDSDDILLPDKLSDAVNTYLGDSNIDLVYSSWIVESDNRSIEMKGPDLEKYPFAAELVLHYLCSFSAVYKRSILNHAGLWNESLTCSQDREFCVRVFSYAKKAKRIDRVGGIYRLHSSSNGISGSGNPRHPISAWHANQLMRSHIIHEPSPLRYDALNTLALRNLKNAANALYNGYRQYCVRILISDRRIWLLSIRNSILAVGLLIGVALPKKLQQVLVRQIKPRIWEK